MYEKFSDGARRALTRAKAEAGARDSDEITLVHILAGLVHSESEASNLLAAVEVDAAAIERLLEPPRVDPTELEPSHVSRTMDATGISDSRSANQIGRTRATCKTQPQCRRRRPSLRSVSRRRISPKRRVRCQSAIAMCPENVFSRSM